MADTQERLTAALAGQYEVERLLGEGGMATVYLARDVKHDREVAIKVIHPDLAASMGEERFLREIQITAKLHHPHILSLYDSGEADGLLYYVMPYIRGESLRQRLDREMQLPLEEAVLITREVADALSHAHTYGLIHRDIKPENIMLSGGHAIVADFGVARAISAAGDGTITKTGMAVGTPAYMSPEQAMGDPKTDARADVYALGCVLYEMVVGQIPFTGPTPQAIMARHSMDIVTPPSIMRGTVPEDLEDIILCAMAKAPADRFKTAMEMGEALKAVASGQTPQVRKTGMLTPRSGVTAARARQPRRWPWIAAGAGVVAVAGGVAWWQLAGTAPPGGAVDGPLDLRRVAVLYFEDLSSDSSLGYVADGLTEGLIDRLASVRTLDVISRGGVAPYRDTDLTRDSIARVLNAGTLITGSVEPAGGDQLRVTTRLVDGASDTDVERAGFTLPAGELLAIGDSAAGEIARVLRRWLGEEVRLREQRTEQTTVQAWALLQRGEKARKQAEDLIRAGDGGAALARYAEADSLLGAAAAAAPRWTEPRVLRGQVAYQQARLFGLSGERDAADGFIAPALVYADEALTLEPNDAHALELRGTARYLRWILGLGGPPQEADALLQAAREDLEGAIAAEPALASAHSTLSHLYYQTDDVPAAVFSARRAYEEDAYLTVADEVLYRLFLGSYDLELFTQAGDWCAEGARRFPDDYRFTECQLWMMTTSAGDPDPDGAWSLLEQLTELTPEHLRPFETTKGTLVVGGVLARAELTDSALAVLDRAHPSPDEDPTQELVGLEAFMRTLAHDEDGAIDLLKRYAAAHHGFRVGADMHWWWRDLQRHPRFREVQSGSN